MANILDVEKIAEIGKIDIPGLKLILRELLNDILNEKEKTQDVQMDISVILKLLFEKGFITKDEYESLKEKLNSLINSDKLDDAFNQDMSDEAIEEIIKKSKFKGFFKTYDELVDKIPVSKATHGDYAYIKDFDADTYDINNIEEYIYDIHYKKWMSATDTTHLRNVYIREDEEDTGRLNGQPIDNDLLQYNEALKRWICKTYEEADIARKSHLDFHISNKIELTKDEVGNEDGSIRDNGRLIVKLDTSTPNKESMHIDKENFKKLLEQIDKDYYSRVHVDFIEDDLGVRKIAVLGDDYDKYGNAIRRNITNSVLKKILKNIYDQMLSTFDIPVDETTHRILKLNDEEPKKYVPKGINTYNVDKIIEAIDRDYNNSFRNSDKEENNYVDILKRVLEGYNELDINDDNSQDIIARLSELYKHKNLWDRYTKIISYEENKNMTPEVFNELIDLIHYLYISKDLIRDEIKERDITINGNRVYTKNAEYIGEDNHFLGQFKRFELTNSLCTVLINAGLVKFDNTNGAFLINHKLFKIDNEESIVEVNSKSVNFTNKKGEFNVSASSSTFEKDVLIKGNLVVKGTTTEVDTENLNVSDNVIILNKGEIGNGVSRNISGLKIDRGQADDYFVGYYENKKRLVYGEIKTEDEIEHLDYIATIPNQELVERKPIVYNTETKMLNNSSLIDTDINGATTFVLNIPDNTFKVLDPVYFDGDELKLCSIKKYKSCEVVGIVGAVNNEEVKIVTNGFIETEELSDIKSGTILFLDDNKISDKYHPLIRRKVGLKIPNGIIVDIQKNSDNEQEDLLREQKIHRVVPKGTFEIEFGYDFILNWKTKIFVDGNLLIEDVHYSIHKYTNTLILNHVYEYDIDLLAINSISFANDENEYMTNDDVDNIFKNLDPITPFVDAEYMEDYEIDRIFGIMTEPTPNNPVIPIESEWLTNEEINDIFKVRELYKTYDLNNVSIKKPIIMSNEYIHYFNDKTCFKEYDFISLTNGKLIISSISSENIIGIVEKIIHYDNGLIEHIINRSQIVSYEKIPLTKYIKKYKTDFSIGDKIYINETINKFKGKQLGTFTEIGLFIEFTKNKTSNTKFEKHNNNIYTLKEDIYYLVDTPTFSITSLDLFEVDSPNYCKLNLINNSMMNEKNLYYDIQLGKQLVDIYRLENSFVIKPVRELKCNTNIKFTETNNIGLVPI